MQQYALAAQLATVVKVWHRGYSNRRGRKLSLHRKLGLTMIFVKQTHLLKLSALLKILHDPIFV